MSAESINIWCWINKSNNIFENNTHNDTLFSDGCILKEPEHRKLGLKVLILEYDLGKSLSKEMWCNMADTQTLLTTYF